jgi:hypothetical protein
MQQEQSETKKSDKADSVEKEEVLEHFTPDAVETEKEATEQNNPEPTPEDAAEPEASPDAKPSENDKKSDGSKEEERQMPT